MFDAIMTMMHPPGPDTCEPIHDPAAFYLSLFISIGLLVSYLPQHGRIIYNRSSEGIDPMFLLLGSTSSASSLLNILALSWSAVRCCPFLVRVILSTGWSTECSRTIPYRLVSSHDMMLTSSSPACMHATRCAPIRKKTRSACLESLMGVFQIGLQWLCFNLVWVPCRLQPRLCVGT